MRQIIRISFFTLIYLFCIVAFFGIANGLGWDIEPGPAIVGGLITVYIGGLLPLWKSGGSSNSNENKTVDWDKEMKRREKMAKARKKKAKK